MKYDHAFPIETEGCCDFHWGFTVASSIGPGFRKYEESLQHIDTIDSRRLVYTAMKSHGIGQTQLSVGATGALLLMFQYEEVPELLDRFMCDIERFCKGDARAPPELFEKIHDLSRTILSIIRIGR